jgi:uncharacterized protein YggU (UPF0235/DUF167 family)
VTSSGVTVAVKAQPKSRRPGLQGLAPDIEGMRLRVGVTDAAEDGRANKAVCALLAASLGVAVSQVSVLHGATSRQKSVHVAGDPAVLSAKLTEICQTLTGAES